MNNLHQSLMDKQTWYAKWHNHPKQHLIQWVFLFVVVGGIASAFYIKANNPELALNGMQSDASMVTPNSAALDSADDTIYNTSTFSVSPASLQFLSTPGVSPTPQVITITNSKSTTLQWQSASDQYTWCFTNPRAGAINSLASVEISAKINPLSEPGNHSCTIRVIETDSSNPPQLITVNYVVADTTPPAVSLRQPVSNATVSGSIYVQAIPTDNVGVAGVQFKIDDVNICPEDLTFPHSCFWNTASVTNGTHTVTAVARDTSNNIGTSVPRTITVNNPNQKPLR